MKESQNLELRYDLFLEKFELLIHQYVNFAKTLVDKTDETKQESTRNAFLQILQSLSSATKDSIITFKNTIKKLSQSFNENKSYEFLQFKGTAEDFLNYLEIHVAELEKLWVEKKNHFYQSLLLNIQNLLTTSEL